MLDPGSSSRSSADSIAGWYQRFLGILGISLGGYYAPRAAVFEPRIKACVAWGGIWDYGATWRKRWHQTGSGRCSKTNGSPSMVMSGAIILLRGQCRRRPEVMAVH